jgi:hypothetical protein
MGIWRKMNIPLPGLEGLIVSLFQSEKEPGDQEVEMMGIGYVPLFHYPECNGTFELIKISDAKKVLFCKHCGLRLSIPKKLEKIKDLREFLK